MEGAEETFNWMSALSLGFWCQSQDTLQHLAAKFFVLFCLYPTTSLFVCHPGKLGILASRFCRAHWREAAGEAGCQGTNLREACKETVRAGFTKMLSDSTTCSTFTTPVL